MIAVLNQRGGNHNSCEDSVWVEESDKFIVGGVFDGCSTGVKSHWASQTISYAFKKEASDFKHGIYSNLNDFFMFNVAYHIESVCSALSLNPKTSVLSTCLMFLYDKHSKTLEIRCFGDGVYYVNDIEYTVDQGNIPDYLGYVLNEPKGLLSEFLLKYPSIIYDDVDRFIICSDGIQSIAENQYESKTVNWEELLLSPPKSENYLKRMWNILKNKKFTLGDDLTIVSYATT